MDSNYQKLFINVAEFANYFKQHRYSNKFINVKPAKEFYIRIK